MTLEDNQGKRGDMAAGVQKKSGYDRSHGQPALSRVWQHVLSDVSL